MAIIGTTDLHLTDNPMDEYRFAFIEQHFPAECKAGKGVDGILILGDLTEEKDRHSARLVNRIVRALDKLSRIAPTVVLMGNHDYHDEGHPFFEFLSHIENLRFISAVTDGQEMGPPFVKLFRDYLFLPHTRAYLKDWEKYIKDGWGGFDAIFAHNTFDGADTGYGRKLEGIPVDVFGKKAQVLAGDIHAPQTLGPVTYIGSPYTVDFGDDYDPRLMFIEGNKVKWRSVGNYTQKRLVHITHGKDLLDYKKQIQEGDILKVRVDVDDMKAWGAIVRVAHAQAKQLGARAERVEPVISFKAKRKLTVSGGSESAASDAEVLRSFADRHNLDDDKLNVGLDLLEGESK